MSVNGFGIVRHLSGRGLSAVWVELEVVGGTAQKLQVCEGRGEKELSNEKRTFGYSMQSELWGSVQGGNFL